MIDRTIAPPKIKDAIEFNLQLKLPSYEKFVLPDNGVEVYAIDAGAEDVLQMVELWYFMRWQ